MPSPYTPFSDPFAWLALALLAGGSLLHARTSPGDDRRRRWIRRLTAAGWVAFAAMWLVLVPHYAVVQRSVIEAVGAAVAVPTSLFAARRLVGGRDGLFALSRAIGIAGLLYLPFVAVPAVRRMLVETVVRQTEFVIGLTGLAGPDAYRVVSGAETGAVYPFRNSFRFVVDGNKPIHYIVKLACTGVKSMATFVGVAFAVEATTRQRLFTLAVVLPTIYGLNVLRNAFIALTFGGQRLHLAPDLVLTLFADTDPYMVSYYLADRVIAQSLSLVALLALAWVAIRTLPPTLDLVDEAVRTVSLGRVGLRSDR
jgi:archaeosortase A (PGF-CTERM-specific)